MKNNKYPDLLSWMQHKAPVKNEVKRINNTLNEYWSWQHSAAPEAPAEFLALPESRLVR